MIMRTGCGGNANRFISVKNCYKLCHPYYRQRPVSQMDMPTAPAAMTPTTVAITATTVTGQSKRNLVLFSLILNFNLI